MSAKPQAAPGIGPLESAVGSFTAALCADLNISGAIGALNEAVNQYNVDAGPPAVDAAKELDALNKMNSVLGVLDLETEGSTEAGDLDVNRVMELIGQRNDARKDKDFAAADRIRSELAEMGVEIKDGPGGTEWKRVVS